MALFYQLLMFIYIVVAFAITNILAKKYVQKYQGTIWVKRRFIFPVGCLMSTIALFLLAAFTSTEVLILILVPLICFFVGVIAYTSFFKVDVYERDANKNNPYTKKK